MSRPLRPSSERYSVCCSVPDSGSFCSQDGRHVSASSDDDNSPIFSISKSSMDVLTASPHLRDPAFSRLDKPRCSSTSEQHSHQNTFQSSNLSTSLLTRHNLEAHNPHSQMLNDRCFSNMQRWSSCSAQSRSSTPDTVIFKGSRPSSVVQEKAPESSKLTSPPPRTPSPLISPELVPTVPSSNASAQVPQTNYQDDGSPNSLKFSPLQTKYVSPLPARELLCFTFPSPISSSVSLEKFAAEDPLYAAKNSIKEASVDELLKDTLPGNLQLPLENQERLIPDFDHFSSTWRPKLVTSFSDPYLGTRCHCNGQFCKNVTDFRDLERKKIHEEGTMTSNAKLVDVGVQTFSPLSSWWSLKHNNSIAGSPSILGSPPGSQLNLRSPLGSHFNLVSPSSSMFPINSDDEDSKVERDFFSWETSSNTDVERRSCLKVRNINRDLGRRSSMKQVQWDEDGMTWDVHGASIDPEELNMAIQKHLELTLTEEEPKPLKKSSKKHRAPNPPMQLKPPLIQEEEKGKDEVKEEVSAEPSRRRSLSPGPVQRRKRKTFKTPGWCGGSKKHQD